jgi:hypothetical protein
MRKIMAQQAKSQRAMARSLLVARGVVLERVREDKAPLAWVRFPANLRMAAALGKSGGAGGQ